MFEVARWWRLSPFEVESLPLSSFFELLAQALRIKEQEKRKSYGR